MMPAGGPLWRWRGGLAVWLAAVGGFGGCPAPRVDELSAPSIFFALSARALAPPAGQAPFFRRDVVVADIPGKVGHHAPTIVAFDDGELLAAWYSYDGPHELQGAAIYAARRPAGRDEWGAPFVLRDTVVGDGNPVLYAEGEAVWLFCAAAPLGWSSAHVDALRSADRGRTWSAARTLDGPPGTNVRFPPVRLGDGTLVLPAYDDLLQRSLFFASADGERWALRSIIAEPPQQQAIQPSIASGADGALLAVMRNRGKGELWASSSDDGGRSWSRARASGFPSPDSPAALARLASGRLLIVFNDDATERRRLSAALSADDGASWSRPRVLVDDAGEIAYPGVAGEASGAIHVVYSHDRRWIGDVEMNEAWLVE